MGKRKRSNKTNKLPKAFHDDGLADIIEWIDEEILTDKTAKDKSKNKSQVELKNQKSTLSQQPSKSKSDLKTKLAEYVEKYTDKSAKKIPNNNGSYKNEKKFKNETKNEVSESFDSDAVSFGRDIDDDTNDDITFDENEDDDGENDDGDCHELDTDSSGDEDEKTEEQQKRSRKKVKFNIYGDELDSSGRVVNENRAHAKLDIDDSEKLEIDEQLQRKVRGLINRLACANIVWITNQLESFYKLHKRNCVNEAIFRAIDSAGIEINHFYPRELMAPLMLLILNLSEKFGHEFCASFVHRSLVKFDKNMADLGRDGDSEEIGRRLKSSMNIMSCFVNLYTIGLLDGKFIYSVLEKILENFNERTIELILLILRTIGFQLRKDDPLKMKETILKAQQSAQKIRNSTTTNDSQSKSTCEIGRVEFMIEALTAIKNNNVIKLPNYGCDLDRDAIEATMKNLIKRARLSESLNFICYQDVLTSSKWHLLETLVNVRKDNADQQNEKSKTQISGKHSSDENKSLKLISDDQQKIDDKLCRALKLNTPTRRAVFNALIKASDHIEAMNSILSFGIKIASEAMIVCVHLAIHERTYNPFYYHLLNAFCKLDRKYKMATRFAIQDKIRDLKSMNASPTKSQVFSKLTFELIKSDAIPITILKAVEWSNIDKAHTDFLNSLLGDIMSLPTENVRKIFTKVDKKDSFASAIRLFIKCFVDKNVTKQILFK